MSSVVTCNRCGNKIITGGRKFQGKYYCEHCYDIVMKEVQKFEEDKQQVILFIKDLFSLQECPEYVLYVIDRSVKEGKKLSGIKGTLTYYYNIKGNAPDNVNFIGAVIQREYNNAAQYFEEQRKIRATNEQVDINVPPVTVKISPSGSKKKQKYRMEDL